MVEIADRAGLRAIGADPGFRNVEIDLHDPALAPDRFDQEGEPGFQPLAQKAAALEQKDVLRRLLADGGAAPDAAAAGIVAHGLGDGDRIEAVMAAKAAVFGGYCGAGHVRVHFVQAHPVLGDAVGIEDHRPGHRRRDEAVDHHHQQRQGDETTDDLEGYSEPA